jgi:hypothetical protein
LLFYGFARPANSFAFELNIHHKWSKRKLKEKFAAINSRIVAKQGGDSKAQEEPHAAAVGACA